MKKSNFFMVLAIVMMAFTQSVWAITDAHFNLIGDFTKNSEGNSDWSSASTAKPINKSYQSNTSKYYVEVNVVSGTTYHFAFNNKNNINNGDRYAPAVDTENKELSVAELLRFEAVKVSGGSHIGGDADYDHDNNSWKFTANYTGKLRICVDQDNYEGTNEREWYPYVWLERPKFYVIGDLVTGDFWNAGNTNLPISYKCDENKYYVNLYLQKNNRFALAQGGVRFAPEASMDITINDENGQPKTYTGSCGNGQDNSWKYVGESGLVRLVLDVVNETFILEPFNLYLIGQYAEGDDKWAANNTTKPFVTNHYEEGALYMEVDMQQYSYFALSDGIQRYAHTEGGQNKDIRIGDTGQQGKFENNDKSWKYCGETGKVRICVNPNMKDGCNPWVWLEDTKFYVIGDAVKADNQWVGYAPYRLAISQVGENDSMYVDCYLEKDKYVGLSNGTNRYFATIANAAMDGSVRGQYTNNDASWQYHGNTGIVRLTIDNNKDENGNPFPSLKVSRPTVSLKHVWVAESEATAKEMTDNNDGTYTIAKATYSGSAEGYEVVTSYVVNTPKVIAAEGLKTGDDCKFVLSPNIYGEEWTLNITKYNGTPTQIEQTSVVNDNIVYDIMGRALGTSLENLPQGIYVRNGKKFVVAQ
ncbi:MAG: hypothetical protein SOT07_07015 [Paludibacteraceae bacterium]|nr:hypothetical protein [Paludibacteraceae bacterium]